MGHCGRGHPGPVDRCLLRALPGCLITRRTRPPRRARSVTSPLPCSIGPSRPTTSGRPDEPIVAIIRQDIIAQFGAISPDGQYLAIGGSVIRDLCITSIAKKRNVRKFAIRSGSVEALAYSPDGRYLATGRGFMSHMRHDESVNLWDARTGRLIRNFHGPCRARNEPQ